MLGRLPSQRELLTNLVLAICEMHGDDNVPGDANATARKMERHSPTVQDTWNSPQRRNLILTLHVIFPDLVLPALNLLDRHLVQRLALAGRAPENEGGADTKEDPLSLQRPDLGSRRFSEISGDGIIYTVRSLASTLTRRGLAGTVTAKTHLVHLQAWNCSCVSFAVNAYPIVGEQETSEAKAEGRSDDGRGGLSNGWKFGGLSATRGFFGSHGAESVPCCKHLLACLLADNWGDLLSPRVEDTVCTKEELAGIIAGI
ncbi:hypothetical protein NQ176_g6 [Zarea fungicola]|uniref:Uncharacterized protein n=1 Tax=Zarea fungicola TaxID=93591 RepID=A0ACC1NZ43_9HYPO|nr:hypothetical protein NQ176_g6 [Lecanicillium fungicola]